MRPGVLVALGLSWLPAVAAADDNDLVLSRLGSINEAGNDVIPDNEEFRSLMSELGVAIAPKFLTAADTLGFAGFQFSSELGFTSINNDRQYWCATAESTGCSAQTPKETSFIPTWGLFARKGIWLPLPSFELGVGATQVLSSRMWTGQAYAKLALHEGFHDWPIPSLAVRGAVSHLFGASEVNLTVASIDVSISKAFGVEGTVRLQPYAGWNLLHIIPRSEVIDKTPHVAAKDSPDGKDARLNFVFPDQDSIPRQRFFGGLEVKYYVFALAFEANIALAGDSTDEAGTHARDRAGAQQTYSIAISLDL